MNSRLLSGVILSTAAALCLILIPPARGEPIPEVSARLEPEEVIREETAVLTVWAAWTGQATDLVFSRPAPPILRGLALIGSSQRGVAYREGDTLRQVREFIFTLRGEAEGPGRVGPVTLTYRRPAGEESSVATKPIPVFIISPQAAESSSGLPFPAVAGLALTAAVVIGLYLHWMIRRYQNKSNELIDNYVENIESETLRELEGARKHRVEGEPEKYCSGVRSVLLRYLKRKSALSSPPPGREALASVEIPPEVKTELAESFRQLDELRFGGVRDQIGEVDEIYRRIEIILKNLKKVTDSGG